MGKIGICEICNEEKKLKGKVCKKCYREHRQPKFICCGCGENRIVEKRVDGDPYCSKCYGKFLYARPLKICYICGENDRIASYIDDNPICKKCYGKQYEPPKDICSICNNLGEIRVRNEDKVICSKCYEPPKKKCSKCGEIGIIKIYIDNKPFCSKCYKRPKRECFKCKEIKRINIWIDNEPYCEKCCGYETPKYFCSMCDEEKAVHKWEGENPICIGCYKHPEGICSKCGKLKRIAKVLDGSNLCPTCYVSYRCEVDEAFRILTLLRDRFNKALNLYSKTGKIKSACGYGINYEAIINHLGPCPGPREDYHIDHILPLSAFDFNNLEHIKKAFAPKNHQWLKVKDNLSKKDKFNEEEFDKYIKE